MDCKQQIKNLLYFEICNIIIRRYYLGVIKMGDLKDSWKTTGVGLGHAFKNLGKSIVKSASTAAKKVDKWANSQDYDKETTAEEAAETIANASEKKQDENDMEGKI